MLPHKCFASWVEACKYISKQSGIYGSPQRMQIHGGVNIHKEPYLFTSFNGYDIKIMPVE